MTTYEIYTEGGSYCGYVDAHSDEEAEREAEARGFEPIGVRVVSNVREVVVES